MKLSCVVLSLNVVKMYVKLCCKSQLGEIWSKIWEWIPDDRGGRGIGDMVQPNFSKQSRKYGKKLLIDKVKFTHFHMFSLLPFTLVLFWGRVISCNFSLERLNQDNFQTIKLILYIPRTEGCITCCHQIPDRAYSLQLGKEKGKKSLVRFGSLCS